MPLNKKQLEELQKKLEKNKALLEEMLGRFAKKDPSLEGDWDTIFPKTGNSDMEDMADAVEEYASLLPIEHALEIKLKNVDEAIKKIKERAYGKCEICKKEISIEKLSLSPETKKCKECSQKK
jgi:RNA polymerase-binding transcription factor DksA